MKRRWPNRPIGISFSIRFSAIVIVVSLLASIMLVVSPTPTFAINIPDFQIRENTCMGKLKIFNLTFGLDNEIPKNVFQTNVLSPFIVNTTLSLDRPNRCIEWNRTESQLGQLVIAGLIPMAKSEYRMILDIERDNWNAIAYITIGHGYFGIQKLNNDSAKIFAYYEDQGLKNKYFITPPVNWPITVKIFFNGENKSLGISHLSQAQWIPLTYVRERNLPYEIFSENFVIFNSYKSISTYVCVKIYQIEQWISEYYITPVGVTDLQPFGLDGPHPVSTIQNGTNYLLSHNLSATVWVDWNAVRNDQTRIQFVKDLVFNHSWELGIHFTKRLIDYPLDTAFQIMDNEYTNITNLFGKAPTSWCSLQNADNITHAQYAYKHLNMVWRNGRIGVHAIANLGNLDDKTWPAWNASLGAHWIMPCFTHRTDQEPAIDYSISYSNFITWVNSYINSNCTLCSFIEWFYIQRSSIDTYLTDIYGDENRTINFIAHTNGYHSRVIVKYTPNEYTRVFDNKGTLITYEKIDDDHIGFFVEDNITYTIAPLVIKSEDNIFVKIEKWTERQYSFYLISNDINCLIFIRTMKDGSYDIYVNGNFLKTEETSTNSTLSIGFDGVPGPLFVQVVPHGLTPEEPLPIDLLLLCGALVLGVLVVSYWWLRKRR